MTDTTPTDENARHATKMAKKKAARDKIMATKTEKKGLIVIHTGRGKGKRSGEAAGGSRQRGGSGTERGTDSPEPDGHR